MANKRLLADLGARLSALHQSSMTHRHGSKLPTASQPLHQQSTEMTRVHKQVQMLQTQVETLQEEVFFVQRF